MGHVLREGVLSRRNPTLALTLPPRSALNLPGADLRYCAQLFCSVKILVLTGCGTAMLGLRNLVLTGSSRFKARHDLPCQNDRGRVARASPRLPSFAQAKQLTIAKILNGAMLEISLAMGG